MRTSSNALFQTYAFWLKRAALCLLCAWLCGACFAAPLGRRFSSRALAQIKVGFDTQATVTKKMGSPYRRSVDPSGRALWVYLWADGQGEGEVKVVGFNTRGVVFLVENAP